MHLGFGLGVVGVNAALAALNWDPPRYMGTSWENGYMNDEIFRAHLGWIGLDQYDEDNPVAQAFLDRFEAATGRRPGYFSPIYGHDVAQTFVAALANAEPLSPRGVMEALERVKMLPAACGEAGHPHLVRELDPPGLDGCRLPHRPRGHARLPVDGLPRTVGRSFPVTAATSTAMPVSCAMPLTGSNDPAPLGAEEVDVHAGVTLRVGHPGGGPVAEPVGHGDHARAEVGVEAHPARIVPLPLRQLGQRRRARCRAAAASSGCIQSGFESAPRALSFSTFWRPEFSMCGVRRVISLV